MIIVYPPDGGTGQLIRPTPFISVNFTTNSNKSATLGGTYEITLTGTIISFAGSPYLNGPGAAISGGPITRADFSSSSLKPARQSVVEDDKKLGTILWKQNYIRALFSHEGSKVEVCSWDGSVVFSFYPKLQSISFEEGVYVEIARYTISLTADLLFDKSNKVIVDGKALLAVRPSGTDTQYPSDQFNNVYPAISGAETLEDHIKNVGGLVEDYSDTWAVEPIENYGIGSDDQGNTFYTGQGVSRTYRLTRNISATGRTIYAADAGSAATKRYEAWEQARGFVKKRIRGNSFEDYPRQQSSIGYVASGLINLNLGTSNGETSLTDGPYSGYDHSVTENADATNGTYSLTESWVLSSGTAHETYTMSVSKSRESSVASVTINGTIKGLSLISPSSSLYGGNAPYTSPTDSKYNTPYANAVIKFNQLTNGSNFGYSSAIVKRVQNAVNTPLNPIPNSQSISINEFAGEINYDITFNDSAENQVSNTISENISVNDTYPGDVFAMIPVLGRTTGPILQYMGTRTEYRRDFNLDLVFGTSGPNAINAPPTTTTTTLAPGSTPSPPSPQTTTSTTFSPLQYRQKYVMTKPSLNDPWRTQINNIIRGVSPQFEPGIRKFFLNPPTESWDPKSGSYSLRMSWTYELDH